MPQNLTLRINNRFYVHAVQKNDTLTTIAAALAALVAVNVAGTSATGPVITIGPTGQACRPRALAGSALSRPKFAGRNA